MNISEKIKNYRKIKKMTQKELSEKSGISRSHIASIETGKYNPSLDTLKKLAQALTISLESLTSDMESSDEGLFKLVSKLIKATENKKLNWSRAHETDVREGEIPIISSFGNQLFNLHKNFKSKPKGFYSDPKYFWQQDISLEVQEIINLGIKYGAYFEEYYITYDIINESIFTLILIEDDDTEAEILYLGYKKFNTDDYHVLGADIVSLKEKRPRLASNKIATNLKDLRLVIKASSPGSADLIDELIESLDFDED